MGWRRFGSAGPAAGWRVFLGWCGPLRVDAVSGEGALGCGRPGRKWSGSHESRVGPGQSGEFSASVSDAAVGGHG